MVLYPPKISWPNNWPVKKGVPNCWIFWLEKGEMLSERATQVLPSNAVGVASLQVGKAGKVHRGPGGTAGRRPIWGTWTWWRAPIFDQKKHWTTNLSMNCPWNMLILHVKSCKVRVILRGLQMRQPLKEVGMAHQVERVPGHQVLETAILQLLTPWKMNFLVNLADHDFLVIMCFNT